ncbi:MAG TPA: RdgB/HAM1 family non-canonical purine NTP pyrophosphatase [Pyrinomonadaceae bacterium]|nr:RdgB/HAM1 family non-canonical purine NTP pyrophosphatase [Pyrinomonadaceae bacterium]
MKPTELLVATGNAGKLREIRALLADLPITLLSLTDFPNIEEVAETGSTFAENAALKAFGYARQAGMLSLADDSGLVVDALGGAPGVHSARYLGDQASYAERMNALLTALKTANGDARTARFVCALAIASDKLEMLYTTEGTCEGRIAEAPRGSGGFGYDPVFVPESFAQTFGELPAVIKNGISHRGRALAKAHHFLASLTATSAAG